MTDEGLIDPTGHALDFNLSNGSYIDDSSIENTSQPSTSASKYGHETSMKPKPAYLEHSGHSHSERNSDSISEKFPSQHVDGDFAQQDRDGINLKLNYDRLSQGNSDDEDAGEAFDRSWKGRQIRKPATEPKKSMRRDDPDHLEDAIPNSKKPRQSLFGGPVPEDEEPRYDETTTIQAAVRNAKILESGIGSKILDLSHEQQQQESGLSERSFDFGFGAPPPERGGSISRLSPVLSENSITTFQENQPAYELRKNIERNKAFTYIDTDMSGNFDPSDEPRQKMLKLNKARAAKAAKATKAAQQQKRTKKKGGNQAPKEHIMKLIVKLRIEAFGNVRNCTDDEQNWPDNWSDIDSGCERERQECRDFFRSNTPGLHMQMSISDPRNEIDDLTGHPIARGCKSCRKNEDNCSIVEGGEYPCIQCANTNVTCELIIPATTKGFCKQCVADGVECCSFANEPGMAICDHCVEGEFVCEALPPKGYRAKRINIDELVYGEDRPYRACTVCRQEKKRCSLKKSDKPPCKSCKKKHIGCTFFDFPKEEPVNKATEFTGYSPPDPTEVAAPEVVMPICSYFTAEDLADMEAPDQEMPSRETTPEIIMEDIDGNKGILTKILTSFAHPIEFNIKREASDCNFCQMPVFGITGEYEREVHVICWNNGLGYTEVGGGHCEDKGATRMCTLCTANRFQIVYCTDHKLKYLGEGQSMQDFDSVANDLLSTEPGSAMMQSELLRWCSLCFSVAKFECSTIQIPLYSDEDKKDSEIVGCGLRLCEHCERRLTEEFGDDMNLMVCEMEKLSKIRINAESEDLEGRARADVGFLKKDGLLTNNVFAWGRVV